VNDAPTVTSRRRAARRVTTALGALTIALGLTMPGISTAHAHTLSKTTAAAATLHNTCKKSAIDVPRCGVLWGLYSSPVPATPHWVQQYGSFESQLGRRLDIVKTYVDWKPGTTFPNSSQAAMAANGDRILDFSWTAANYTTHAKVSYRSIASGHWDRSVILPEARALKAFHHKVFIDFNHEFDSAAQSGKGTPADYVAAYRHIHHVMHVAGVRNVIWTWVSTGYLPHAAVIKASYPGASFVNWVGYDPYNFAQCHNEGWRTPYQTFQPFYHWLRSQPGMRRKPIMLGEYGSAAGTAVGAWYAGVASALSRLPDIKAALQWNSVTSPTCDFRLSQASPALSGFRASGLSAYVTGAAR
jgi:Glycosyl hydrolase family 26